MIVLLKQVLRFMSCLAFLAVVTSGDAAAEGARPIKMFTSDTNAAPYVMTDGVTFVGGIMKELNDEAAKRAKVRIAYSLQSRRSVDATLLSGDGHLVCNIQPAWTKIADQLVWTEPLFADSDVFWRAQAAKADIHAYSDLKGLSFATYKGYYHDAGLTQQVTDGQTKRIDLYPSENILDVLLAGRADYVVFSKIRGEYLQKSPKYRTAVLQTGLVDSSYQNYCAISRKAPIDIDIKALNEIARDGTLERILAKYR
jgi:polar amino acid transport system substrate-binding protein